MNLTIDASIADVKLVGGDTNNHFGWSVSTGGDFNNDGYNDVIVGARFDDAGGHTSGCAYIFIGSSSPVSTIDAIDANVKLIGEDESDFLGWSVAGGR